MSENRTVTDNHWLHPPATLENPPEASRFFDADQLALVQPRTLGDLLDRFCTASWKLYQVQDQIHLAAKENRGLDPELTRKLVELNLERNRLMTGLETLIFAAVKTGFVHIDPRTKLAHGLEQST